MRGLGFVLALLAIAFVGLFVSTQSASAQCGYGGAAFVAPFGSPFVQPFVSPFGAQFVQPFGVPVVQGFGVSHFARQRQLIINQRGPFGGVRRQIIFR